MCKVNICNIHYKMCILKTCSFSKDSVYVIPCFINVDFKLYDAKIFNISFIIPSSSNDHDDDGVFVS